MYLCHWRRYRNRIYFVFNEITPFLFSLIRIFVELAQTRGIFLLKSVNSFISCGIKYLNAV